MPGATSITRTGWPSSSSRRVSVTAAPACLAEVGEPRRLGRRRSVMRTRWLGAAAAVTVGLTVAGCTSRGPVAGPVVGTGPAGPGPAALRLVSYDSCERAVAALRRAAAGAVGAFGLVGYGRMDGVALDAGAQAGAPMAAAPRAAAPGTYSTTTVHEA